MFRNASAILYYSISVWNFSEYWAPRLLFRMRVQMCGLWVLTGAVTTGKEDL